LALRGFVQAKGRWPDIAVLSQLKTDNTALEGVGVELEPFRTLITLKGKPPIFEIEEFKADLPRIRIATEEREISFTEVRLEAQDGRFDGTRNTLRVPEIRFHSASLTNLLISLAATAGDVSLELRGEKTGLLESIRALNLMPPGWLISGDDRLEVTINVKGENDLTFTSHLTLGELDFQNADGSRMGAKIDTRLDTAGVFELKQRQITLRANLETRRGEVLYDRFYLDFEKTPLVGAMEGRVDMVAGSINLNNGQLGLENVHGKTCTQRGRSRRKRLRKGPPGKERQLENQGFLQVARRQPCVHRTWSAFQRD
jgi:hypothetical protein